MKKIYKGFNDTEGITSGFVFDEITREAKEAGLKKLPEEVLIDGAWNQSHTLYDKSSMDAIMIVTKSFNRVEYIIDPVILKKIHDDPDEEEMVAMEENAYEDEINTYNAFSHPFDK